MNLQSGDEDVVLNHRLFGGLRRDMKRGVTGEGKCGNPRLGPVTITGRMYNLTSQPTNLPPPHPPIHNTQRFLPTVGV